MKEAMDARQSEPTAVGQTKGSRGRARLARGVNVTLTFIYHPDGTMIDGYRADAIRQSFFELCRSWQVDNEMPIFWFNDATTTFKQALYAYLRARYPECQLGANNAVPDLLGQVLYSKWRANRIKLELRRKHEPTGIPTDAAERRSAKKTKLGNSMLNFGPPR